MKVGTVFCSCGKVWCSNSKIKYTYLIHLNTYSRNLVINYLFNFILLLKYYKCANLKYTILHRSTCVLYKIQFY